MFETIKMNGVVLVDSMPKWVHDGLSKDDAQRYFNELTRFYIVETPVESLSASSIPLSSYGWHAPWGKPEYLNRRIKDASSNRSLFYSAKTQKDMELVVKKAGLYGSLESSNLQEVVAIYDIKSNQSLSMLYHIRNALCHGRFVYFNLDNEIWIALEDVTSSRKSDQLTDAKRLTARMLLKQSTLRKWQKIIRLGPLE